MTYTLQTSSGGVSLFSLTSPGRYRILISIPTIACAPAVEMIGLRAHRAVLAGRRAGFEVSEDPALRVWLYGLMAMTAGDPGDLPRLAQKASSLENPGWWCEKAAGRNGAQTMLLLADLP